jgi:hypothetical protein
MAQNENRGSVGGTGRVKPVEIVRRSRWTVESAQLSAAPRPGHSQRPFGRPGIPGSPPKLDGRCTMEIRTIIRTRGFYEAN